MTMYRHEFKEGTVLNADEMTRLHNKLQAENNRPKVTFQEVIDQARQWESDHNPFDRTNDMTQDQFKAAMDAFLLEPDDNLFAVTNAITRGAQVFEGEPRYNMQRLGTKVLAEGLRTRK